MCCPYSLVNVRRCSLLTVVDVLLLCACAFAVCKCVARVLFAFVRFFLLCVVDVDVVAAVVVVDWHCVCKIVLIWLLVFARGCSRLCVCCSLLMLLLLVCACVLCMCVLFFCEWVARVSSLLFVAVRCRCCCFC